jgi:hypothetical protein
MNIRGPIIGTKLVVIQIVETPISIEDAYVTICMFFFMGSSNHAS